MELYGFWVHIHHGWHRVLTIMSPDGIAAARAFMCEDHGTEIVSHPGHLTKYIERDHQALERLITRYDIRILNRPEWEAKKAEFGAAIYR